MSNYNIAMANPEFARELFCPTCSRMGVYIRNGLGHIQLFCVECDRYLYSMVEEKDQ
jgi:hypothetical protein